MSRWLRKALKYVPNMALAIYKDGKLIAVDTDFLDPIEVPLLDDDGLPIVNYDVIGEEVIKKYGEGATYEDIGSIFDKAKEENKTLDVSKINEAIKSGELTDVDYDKFVSVSQVEW